MSTTPATPPPVLPPQIDTTFKDAIFSLITTTIDAKMPDIVQGAENLFKTELLRWIDTQKKLFDNGLADGFKKLEAELKLKLNEAGKTIEEKAKFVLNNLDDLARALGAPDKVVSALKRFEEMEKPVDFISNVFQKLMSGNRLTNKEVLGIIGTIGGILSVLAYFLGDIFGISVP